MTIEKFNYLALGGLIDINTLSPNRQFYYRLLKPKEITFGNYGTKLAFYDKSGSLLYHRSGVYSHEIKMSDNKIGFVNWSVDGIMAYLLEFQKGEINEDLFINMVTQECYRVSNENSRISDIWGGNRENFIDKVTLKKADELAESLRELGIAPQKPYLDKVGNIITEFGLWHP